MVSVIQCPSCGKQYQLKVTIPDGKTVRCRDCQHVWVHYAAETAFHGSHPGLADPVLSETPRQQAEPHRDASAARPHGQENFPASGARPRSERSPAPADYQPPRHSAESASQPVRYGYGAEDDGGYPGREDADAQPPGADMRHEPVREDGWAADLASSINQTGQFAPYPPEADERNYAAQADFSGGDPFAGYGDRNAGDGYGQPDPYGGDASNLAGAQWPDPPSGLAPFEIAAEEEHSGLTARGGPLAQRPEDMGGALRPRRSGGLAAAAGWGAYFAVVVGVGASLLAFRSDVMCQAPATQSYYEMLGLAPPPDSLRFENVVYNWTDREGRPLLEVRGQVANTADMSLCLPLLSISLRDDQGFEILKTVATIVTEPLAPQARSTFTLEFLSPPDALSNVELTLGDAE